MDGLKKYCSFHIIMRCKMANTKYNVFWNVTLTSVIFISKDSREWEYVIDEKNNLNFFKKKQKKNQLPWIPSGEVNTKMWICLSHPEHLSSPQAFSGVCVVQSLIFCVVLCRSLCVSICPIWYIQTFLAISISIHVYGIDHNLWQKTVQSNLYVTFQGNIEIYMVT